MQALFTPTVVDGVFSMALASHCTKWSVSPAVCDTCHVQLGVTYRATVA